MDRDPHQPAPGSAAACFREALRLGLGAFGGPVAHIGHFERHYVRRLGWIDGADFAGLLALCQLVPGPSSSQLGYLIGYRRAGLAGALAAWAGFTLPSALAMALLGLLLRHAGVMPAPLLAVVSGLQIVTVAVVAQAVLAMARGLCRTLRTRIVAVGGCALALMLPVGWGQIVVLAAGAVAGAALLREGAAGTGARVMVPTRTARAAMLLLAVGAVAAAVVPTFAGHGLATLMALLARSGALVFGGGHVVLPLLDAALVPGQWIDRASFLAGYGAAQVLPGPLFTFGAFIGAMAAPAGAGPALAFGWAMAALAALFAPGLLIATAILPLWQALAHHPGAHAAMAGINAAVVGLLAAVLAGSVVPASLHRPGDAVIALAALALLLHGRVPVIAVIALTVAARMFAPF